MRSCLVWCLCVAGLSMFGCSPSGPNGVFSGADGSSSLVADAATSACHNCAASSACCGTLCVDTMTDAQHCGGCNTVCQSGLACVNGHCQCGSTYCTSQQTCCSGTCVDTTSSMSHCGSCTNACTGGQMCVSSACKAPTCSPACSGSSPNCCSNYCTNTATDVANCGSCGHACTSGQSCVSSSCTTTAVSGCCCDPNSTTSTCPGGMIDMCVALSTIMAGLSGGVCLMELASDFTGCMACAGGLLGDGGITGLLGDGGP